MRIHLNADLCRIIVTSRELQINVGTSGHGEEDGENTDKGSKGQTDWN